MLKTPKTLEELQELHPLDQEMILDKAPYWERDGSWLVQNKLRSNNTYQLDLKEFDLSKPPEEAFRHLYDKSWFCDGCRSEFEQHLKIYLIENKVLK